MYNDHYNYRFILMALLHTCTIDHVRIKIIPDMSMMYDNNK